MKAKGQVALAVGAGYMLGRTHRMKMALMLAAAGATGRFPGGPRVLLERGTKMLASSPEVAKIGESVRGELLNAARAAAVTAASQRIESLNSRLQSGGEGLTDTVGGVADVAGVGDVVRKKGRRSRKDDVDAATVDAEPEDEYADEEAEIEDEQDEDEPEPEPAVRRPTARRRATSGAGSRNGESRSESAADEGDEPAPRVRKTRAQAPTDAAPVRRGRR
ncbi:MULTISPECIES: hypothetical protein [Rhodococcus]|jgi:hypothetical protein|uniref:Uncharacterized protein n=1 Tax=Rhodococcus oxybenzonivorans TaxID=1990687 RepID=A0AAE4V6D3_9NOCA|nr:MULTISPECIES: hypothetical protein [Rhodococcus]MDV7242965.1 hypothetical protein [Rhodococcus oxybenzonivorans]MDV7268771.1 hypothetical protein [Rhodococcus oxybenzonivorans]MDV7275369.1 hypothetical protein [Rhodococcus oxybenzonivorans]MDV7334776.1 hypothetical protein [Rhodococcus oxybenzonivorans]MDV7344930.1 hypothetical protein [Rhodococcus oxybenzonivorans]